MKIQISATLMVLILFFYGGGLAAETALTVTDAAGQVVSATDPVRRVICSGPGALRLLTYLGAQESIVAVDDIETGRRRLEARPYALANPDFRRYPVFGEFRGFDNPERILALKKQPQLIFKTYPTMGHDPLELQQKTGIPTVVLDYGNLGTHRKQLSHSLRLMGELMHKRARAEAVIAFFDKTINDLRSRTEGIPAVHKKTCYVGGIAYKGPHGFRSTEPGYPPFVFVKAANVAYDKSMLAMASRQVTVAKEKLLEWNPEVLFLDLSTLQLEGEASGLWELKNDPVLKTLDAVKTGRVYGVLPYNLYTKNFGSILADAYFIGKILYPERFTDVVPAAKADEIYEFLIGRPVFDQVNALFEEMAFKAVLE